MKTLVFCCFCSSVCKFDGTAIGCSAISWSTRLRTLCLESSVSWSPWSFPSPMNCQLGAPPLHCWSGHLASNQTQPDPDLLNCPVRNAGRPCGCVCVIVLVFLHFVEDHPMSTWTVFSSNRHTCSSDMRMSGVRRISIPPWPSPFSNFNSCTIRATLLPAFVTSRFTAVFVADPLDLKSASSFTDVRVCQ